MKQLLFAFMLLATLQSNGQSKKDTTVYQTTKSAIIPSIGSYNLTDSAHQYYSLFFTSNAKTSAYLKSGSDTLEVFDSVIKLYGNKIRYIKTMNGSIIKL